MKFGLAAGLLLLALPVSADEARIHPYGAAPNYCPAGLQPVVLGGDVSCGVPDQTVDYFAMKRQPAGKARPRLPAAYGRAGQLREAGGRSGR